MSDRFLQCLVMKGKCLGSLFRKLLWYLAEHFIYYWRIYVRRSARYYCQILFVWSITAGNNNIIITIFHVHNYPNVIIWPPETIDNIHRYTIDNIYIVSVNLQKTRWFRFGLFNQQVPLIGCWWSCTFLYLRAWMSFGEYYPHALTLAYYPDCHKVIIFIVSELQVSESSTGLWPLYSAGQTRQTR